MLLEFMDKLPSQFPNSDIKFGTFNLEQGARIIQARLAPIKAPDMRLFNNAKGINYFGRMNLRAVVDWIKKKTEVATRELMLE
jgi:hypothetical protein